MDNFNHHLSNGWQLIAMLSLRFKVLIIACQLFSPSYTRQPTTRMTPTFHASSLGSSRWWLPHCPIQSNVHLSTNEQGHPKAALDSNAYWEGFCCWLVSRLPTSQDLVHGTLVAGSEYLYNAEWKILRGRQYYRPHYLQTREIRLYNFAQSNRASQELELEVDLRFPFHCVSLPC